MGSSLASSSAAEGAEAGLATGADGTEGPGVDPDGYSAA